MSEGVLTRPSRWPIRVATTATATLVVLLVMALACGGAMLALRSSVHRSADTTALDRAHDVGDALRDRGPIAATNMVVEPAHGVDLVRIVRADGVLLASRPARGVADLDRFPAPPPGGAAVHDVDTPAGVEYRVTTISVDTPGGTFLVHVGTDTRRNDQVLDAVALLLGLFVPIAGLATGVFTWVTMGRVLRPVESIRARVAEISASDLGERVPVPEAEDEVARLARTMNEMLARLDAARRAQVAFVGDASHELRSPLSTLSTMLELSSTSGRPVDVDTVDDLLMPEVQRMRAMIEDLLLAKIDERGRPMRNEDVDLDDIVLAEATRLRGMTAGDLRVRIAVEPARLVGDPDALVRVVRNLADNARRHAHGTVDLTLSVDRTDPAAPRATVIVDDDGDGVPPEQRRQVFDRFARLDQARGRDSGGSGLGLAIVTETARVHGGTAAVTDSPTGGARFTVTLPVEPLDAPEEDDEGHRVDG